MYGQDIQICACCGHIPSQEGVDKLFDGKDDTKLLFEPKIEDINGYNITITSLPPPTTEPLADGQVAAEAAKTSIAAYAITSANDFPGRDPKSFKLSARNPGDTDWVVLDVQRDVLFRNRFEVQTFKIAPVTGVWDETGALGTWVAYTEYMITVLEVHDLTEKHCGSFFCVQFAELGLFPPGELPTTSTTTTTTTVELPWPALPVVSNWPAAPSGWGEAEWRLKVTAGGTVQWILGAKSNLISGTQKEPDTLFGFLKNKPAGFVYNHTFEMPGEYPFFASATNVKGVVVVGGPATTIPQPWPTVLSMDTWPNAPKKGSSSSSSSHERLLVRITPGGTVVWNLQNRSNLIAGTPEDPDDLFGFFVNRDAGTEYKFTFYKYGLEGYSLVNSRTLMGEGAPLQCPPVWRMERPIVNPPLARARSRALSRSRARVLSRSPDIVVCFIQRMLRCTILMMSSQCKRRGKYPFYSSTTGTRGMVEVGGPAPLAHTNIGSDVAAGAERGQGADVFNAKRLKTFSGGAVSNRVHQTKDEREEAVNPELDGQAHPHADTFYADGRPIHDIPLGVNHPAEQEERVQEKVGGAAAAAAAGIDQLEEPPSTDDLWA